MIEKVIIITNNPMSQEKLCDKYDVEFIHGNVLEVMKSVRNHIHKGHQLLTHPLMSSIKPNETPYRTIILTKEGNNNMDLKSLYYIEEAIICTEKFLKDFGTPNWSTSVLEDFKLIDYDIISHGLE